MSNRALSVCCVRAKPYSLHCKRIRRTRRGRGEEERDGGGEEVEGGGGERMANGYIL